MEIGRSLRPLIDERSKKIFFPKYIKPNTVNGLYREAKGMFSANQNAPEISGGGGGRAGSHPVQGPN